MRKIDITTELERPLPEWKGDKWQVQRQQEAEQLGEGRSWTSTAGFRKMCKVNSKPEYILPLHSDLSRILGCPKQLIVKRYLSQVSIYLWNTLKNSDLVRTVINPHTSRNSEVVGHQNNTQNSALRLLHFSFTTDPTGCPIFKQNWRWDHSHSFS